MATLHPLLPNVVNTTFEPAPGKDKMSLLKDATRLTISDMIGTLGITRQVVETASATQLVNLAKTLRSIQPVAL
jgi:hypothetical protein